MRKDNAMEVNGLEYTKYGKEKIVEIVSNPYFFEKDVELLYDALSNKLNVVSFGDYLRRFLTRRVGREQEEGYLSAEECQRMIVESFKETQTPPAFTNVTSKISALAKNWLTQQSVKREVVFLLGFGLKMTNHQVHEMLQKALQEKGVNPKNSFEIICWYCYKNGFSYSKYEELMAKNEKLRPGEYVKSRSELSYTRSLKQRIQCIDTEEDLFDYLIELKNLDGENKACATSRRLYMELYEAVRELIAERNNRFLEAENEYELMEYRNQLIHAGHNGTEVATMLQKRKDSIRKCDVADVSAVDIEQILSSGIPTDNHGNLISEKKSSLYKQFMGKRFTRQHFYEITARKREVTRFDIITMNFLKISLETTDSCDAKERYRLYIESTNRLLSACDFSRIYTANVYECFVLMCVLADEPICTYADVMEKAYDEYEE